MFIPRALRLKGVKERPKETTSASGERPAKKARIKISPGAIDEANTSRELDQQEQNDTRPARGPTFTTPQVTHEFLGWLVAGMEMIFSDYAYQAEEGAAWLEKHYREVDREGKFIHLSAILKHPYISSLNKPTATVVFLQRALQERPSEYLELAKNSYFVRRRPTSYPLHFIPQNSFNVVDDRGISFWDRRTIYVEPHIRGMCKTPARLAYWLRWHGDIKAKWLPIQDVQFLFNSCAFVVLSGNVTHESAWSKWREKQKPEYWRIMTKAEHSKRTNKYLELLNQGTETESGILIRKDTRQALKRTATKKINKGDYKDVSVQGREGENTDDSARREKTGQNHSLNEDSTPNVSFIDRYTVDFRGTKKTFDD